MYQEQCSIKRYIISIIRNIKIIIKRIKQKNLVKALGSDSGKIILILLTKVITFYIEFTIVYIYGAGF